MVFVVVVVVVVVVGWLVDWVLLLLLFGGLTTPNPSLSALILQLVFIFNVTTLKQNEGQSARAESTHRR